MTDQLEVRHERAARNQSLFRQVNERIEALNESFGLVLPMGDWVCECANESCIVQIELTLAEYEAVRKRGDHFVVAPSEKHVWPDVEHVVKRTDRYWVVEKVGESSEMAKAIDPRA